MSQSVRVRRRSGYSTIPNSVIRNTNLSAEARLMLCYIMSCSEDWIFYRAKSMEILGCGRDKYQKIIRELRDSGYLVIHAKRGEGGRLDGQEWEIIDEPGAQDVGGGGPEAAQDVASAPSDREPENQAPGVEALNAVHREPEKTARRSKPPAGESGPLRKNNKQKEKQTSCAASAPHGDFDFGSFFDEVWRLCPRQDSWAQTEEAVKAVIDGGAVPADVLGATRAYAKRTAGHDPSRIKYSQNFFADGFWEQFVPKRAAKVDQAEILRRRAADITSGKPFLIRSISAHAAGECITAGLVTAEQCRDAGINL